MDHLNALKAAAEKAVADQQTLVKTAADAGRELTADETKAYDDLTAKVDGLLAKFDDAKAQADRAARVAALTVPAAPVDVKGTVAAVTQTPAAEADAAGMSAAFSVWSPDLTPQQKLGVFAWAKAFHALHPDVSDAKALEAAGYKQMADAGRAFNAKVMKGLTTLTGQGGDNMIYTPLSNDFIPVLRARSAFLSGGPVEMDMPLGSMDIPGGNAGMTGTYGAEGADIGYTVMTTRKVNLKAKHLRAVTGISNFLIETSPLQVASLVGEDLLNGIVTALDAAGLRGDGSGDNPTGLRNLIAGANVFAAAAGASPAAAAVDLVLKTALNNVAKANIPVIRQRWVMANRVYYYLRFMRDGNGNFLYPELKDGMLLERPISVSEQVPTNLGGGTIDSELYMQDFGHVVAGVTRAIQLTASKEASYKNATPTLVSAFSLDETAIRAVSSHDFDVRYDKSGSIATAVQWG